jgi:hypothetical protein
MPAALQLDYGPELARARIAERVRDKEHQAWNKAKRTGIAFVGPRRLLKLAHTKRAKSYEVFGSLNPQFAAAGHRGAATEAVKRLRAFKAQYARACRVDRRRPERVLSRGHLVDAGVSWGAVRAQGTICWGVTTFDGPVAVNGSAWGASTGEMAHNARSPPARDGPGAALHHRQRRQDLLWRALRAGTVGRTQ